MRRPYWAVVFFGIPMRLLLIDNHDSFSAILYQYLWELTGVRPLFHRNDALSREELQSLDFDAAVLSPGPGRPENRRDFGICRDLLELHSDLPILGVCLGHQGLAHFAGGRIIPLPGALHGRPDSIRHIGSDPGSRCCHPHSGTPTLAAGIGWPAKPC